MVSKCLPNTAFVAGNIANHFSKWIKLTSDPKILELVSGYKLELHTQPIQCKEPNQIKFSEGEGKFMEQEIEKLLIKGVIIESEEEQGQFVSNVFLRPKKDGGFRMILNLKPLNKYINFHHFKMDSVHTCAALMTPNAYMASLDLQDAYYSVPIVKPDQKYLKFRWNGILYQYTCMAMGLTSAPRQFTQLLKPALSHLRANGYMSSVYLDDLFLLAHTHEECMENVKETVKMFSDLGFMIHQTKSNFTPQQKIEHLGFVLNSVNMTMKLPERRINNLCALASNLKTAIHLQ